MVHTIELETTKERYIISVDKNAINQDTIHDLINRLRLEYLLEKADFQEDINSIGDEIKASWWQKNKEDILKRINTGQEMKN